MARDFGKHLSDRMQQLNPNNLPTAVGIAWYRPETYARCLALFEDAADLPATYDDWLIRAEQTVQQLQQQGLKVVRAEIDPDTFARWCAEEGFTNIDRHARVAFGNIVARDAIQGG